MPKTGHSNEAKKVVPCGEIAGGCWSGNVASFDAARSTSTMSDTTSRGTIEDASPARSFPPPADEAWN